MGEDCDKRSKEIRPRREEHGCREDRRSTKV